MGHSNPAVRAVLTVGVFACLAAVSRGERTPEELETADLPQLRKQFYFNWGTSDAIAGIRREMEHSHNPSERQEMQEAIAELEPIVAVADPKKPLPTLKALFGAKSKGLQKLGVKIVISGGFAAELVELKETNPEAAKAAEEGLTSGGSKDAPRDPSVDVADCLQEIPDLLEAWKKGSKGEADYLAELFAKDIGEDPLAFENWFKSAKPYLDALPGLRQTYNGCGLLYVNEEARAAGVEVSRWRQLSDRDRLEKLKGATIPKDWRRIDLRVEVKTPWARAEEPSGVGIHILVQGDGLPLWYYMERKQIAEAADGWTCQLLLRGPGEDLQAVKEKCRAFRIPCEVAAPK